MRCSGILKAISVATVLLLGALVTPATAEAQARGTLQATATVVDTRTSFASLDAARNALRPAGEQQAVETVAQVSTQRPEDRPGVVVVTIDYSRN
jgi:hypothetical protein